MKTAATIYLGLSLVGVGVMGFLALGCQGLDCGHIANDHRLCIASKIQAADCPKAANVVDFTNFHLGALKSLAAAADSAPAAAVFLYIVSALAAAALVLTSPKEAKENLIGFFSKEPGRLEPLPVESELARWLALREKRDPECAPQRCMVFAIARQENVS